MVIEDTEIEDVKLITPRRFEDGRGFFSEVYNLKALAEAGIDLEFVQDSHSFSAEVGTICGLHFPTPPFAQDKLVRVARGAILDVAVDLRRGSKTFGRHVTAERSSRNCGARRLCRRVSRTASSLWSPTPTCSTR
jgi:dTDP-4-dehydrorhamnose 3,5-epimerase